MSENQTSNGWDESADLVIIGSGAGAMTAAIRAHDLGAKVMILEKTNLYGGNSAMSGGAMWIPCNPQLEAAGVEDSPEKAMTYLKHVTRGEVPDERLQAYIEQSPRMLEYLTKNARLEVEAMLTYADYYADAPGGTPGGRSLEPVHFDAKLLGDEFEQLREPALQELVVGRMSMSATEAHHLLARHPGWVKLTAKIFARYYKDFSWRLKSRRDRCLSLGNSLVAMLRMSLIDRGVSITLNTKANDFVVENGRVVGVEAEQSGRPLRVKAEKAVLLASGGFESNQAMREQYLPGPTEVEWTTGSPGSTGDGHEMGLKLGAGLGFMDDAWWGPTSVVPGEERARMLVIEKGLPGCIIVNKAGRRFVNEASPYVDIVKQMYECSKPGAESAPAYMVFDANYRKKYPCGPFLQSQQQPDWALPEELKKSGYLKKSDTLQGLAAELGVDAAGLEDEVRTFNDNARKGVDPDYQRGEGVFDRYYGDDKVKPNPCLAPLETAPYYGIIVYPGELGTKGGLTTDSRARVIKEDGSVIEGLYATGNVSASVMGPTYPGAGATIGPAMTFGFVVAEEVMGGA